MQRDANVNVKSAFSDVLRNLTVDSESYLRFIVYLSTVAVVLSCVILAFLSYFKVVEGFGTPTDFVTIAILGGTGIYGGYTIVRTRRIQKIDGEFPDFVRDLAESKKAGMTFTKAILLASKGSYGALTPEIQKMARQISWGQSVNDALMAFARRVNTPLIKRTVSLIVEASKGGGSTADVLEAASRDAMEIKFLQSERKANMSSYIIIVYIGAMSFLGIIVILCSSLLPNLTEGANALPGVGGGLSMTELRNIFFYGAMVQSFGSGLVAGVFETGNFQAGAKHAFILVFVTWFVFKVFVGGI